MSRTWVNYTGCDSLFSVAADASTVYVGGHQRWLDNQNGCDAAGTGALSRPGIGGVEPRHRPRHHLEPHPLPRGRRRRPRPRLHGLWVASDDQNSATQCGHEYHPGICLSYRRPARPSRRQTADVLTARRDRADYVGPCRRQHDERERVWFQPERRVDGRAGGYRVPFHSLEVGRGRVVRVVAGRRVDEVAVEPQPLIGELSGKVDVHGYVLYGVAGGPLVIAVSTATPLLSAVASTLTPRPADESRSLVAATRRLFILRCIRTRLK